jgi:ankyrin repeat protein
MKTTYQSGLKIINEVNKSDVKEIEAGAISQDAAHPAGKRSLKAGVSETPLTLAINEEDEDLVKRLLEIGADVNFSNRRGQMPITIAVGKSNVAIVQLLLNTDKVNIDIETENGQTLFKYASQIANYAS